MISNFCSSALYSYHSRIYRRFVLFRLVSSRRASLPEYDHRDVSSFSCTNTKPRRPCFVVVAARLFFLINLGLFLPRARDIFGEFGIPQEATERRKGSCKYTTNDSAFERRRVSGIICAPCARTRAYRRAFTVFYRPENNVHIFQKSLDYTENEYLVSKASL